MHFEKIKFAFCKEKVVKHGHPSRKNGEELYYEVQNLPKVTTNGDFIIPDFKVNLHKWTRQSVFWELPVRDTSCYITIWT